MITLNPIAQQTAKQAAQELATSIKFEGRLDWDDLWNTRLKAAHMITSLGGLGYLVEKMTPGEAAFYIVSLMLAHE